MTSENDFDDMEPSKKKFKKLNSQAEMDEKAPKNRWHFTKCNDYVSLFQYMFTFANRTKYTINKFPSDTCVV